MALPARSQPMQAVTAGFRGPIMYNKVPTCCNRLAMIATYDIVYVLAGLISCATRFNNMLISM